MMDAMGITRVADVTGLDTLGIPVVMVIRPNARSVSVSQGKGSTLDAARVSGLMESMEGYHAEHMDHVVRIGSADDLRRTVTVVDDKQLPRMQGSRFNRQWPIAWIEAMDLMSDRLVWVPYEMVHTNYTYPRPAGSGCFPASSNGLASGNTLEEAIVHGICEVIERDALSLWHQSDSDTIDATSIDQSTVDSAACQQTLASLSESDQDTCIWDITSDTGIPTYVAVIIDRNSRQQHIGVGSGTHLSREVALLRALHEAVQVRTTYIVGARDDISRHEYTVEGVAAKQRLFGHLIDQSTFSSSYAQTPDCCSDSIGQDKLTLLNALDQVGLSQILCVDLSKRTFDIAVVRILIPGMESPHDDEGYLPGPRAKRLRVPR